MRGKCIDHTGQKFAKLTVVERAGTTRGFATWRCACECGGSIEVRGDLLRGGQTRSCGCLVVEAGLRRRGKTFWQTHGHTRGGHSPEYITWASMVQRCTNPNEKSWHRYGGRGIGICERWLRRREGFANFLADKGSRPSPKHSLDRFPDRDGDYTPENTRWATPIEQANNTRTNKFVAYDGKLLTVAQWARERNIPPDVLYQRLNRLGWSAKKALTISLCNVAPRTGSAKSRR